MIITSGRTMKVVATTNALADAVASDPARGEQIYTDFCQELADYMKRHYTPRTAAEQYNLVDGAASFRLAERNLPRPSIGWRDREFFRHFGHVADSIISEEEASAQATRAEMEDLGIKDSAEYMKLALRELHKLLGYGEAA